MGFLGRLFGAAPSQDKTLDLAAIADFVPQNPLEEVLLGFVSGGHQDTALLAKTLVESELAVPNALDADAAFRTKRIQVVAYQDPDHGSLIVCFSAPSRVDARVRNFLTSMKSGTTMPAAGFLGLVPAQCGIYVNPGWQVGIQLGAQALQQLKRDFRIGG